MLTLEYLSLQLAHLITIRYDLRLIFRYKYKYACLLSNA